jgi:hypothetical protein
MLNTFSTSTVTARQPIAENALSNRLDGASIMSPQKLARLDLGLLRSLNKLGTSKERICAVLCLSLEEYDYASTLT